MDTTLLIPPDHPAFAGHFPGNPIVPGVVLLDEVLHAIRTAAGLPAAGCRIASAKFLQPVRPGESLLIRHEAGGGDAIRFEVLAGDTRIATGTVTFTPAAAR